jgi:phenylacetic acid degradation operon negative regulatory protein
LLKSTGPIERAPWICRDEYRHLLFDDPDVPPELLPSDWIGHAARSIFIEYNRLLEPAPKRYFDAVTSR